MTFLSLIPYVSSSQIVVTFSHSQLEDSLLEHVEFPTKRWFEWPPSITPWLQSDGWLLVILRYIFGPWAFSTIGRDKLPVSERVKLSACSSLATEPSCLLSRHHAGNDNTYQSYVTKYILLLNLNQSFQSWCVFLQSRAFKYWQCIMTKVASLFLLQILGSFITVSCGCFDCGNLWTNGPLFYSRKFQVSSRSPGLHIFEVLELKSQISQNIAIPRITKSPARSSHC